MANQIYLDLLGMPLRITVAKRGLKQGCIEFKRRDLKDREFVEIEQTVARAQEIIKELMTEIEATVVNVPYQA